VPYSYLAELVNTHALSHQFTGKPSFKTDSELRYHLWTEMAITGERHQKGLYPSVKVTWIDVQNMHQEALIGATFW
jgi:hypothetical protein